MRLKERREEQSRRLPNSTPVDNSEKPACLMPTLKMTSYRMATDTSLICGIKCVLSGLGSLRLV